MASKHGDGGSAFPIEGGDLSGLNADPGMSLRDWFATAALIAWAGSRNSPLGDGQPENVAAACYRYADAMLVEKFRKEDDQP